MQISLSKAYALIDAERGIVLALRKKHEKGSDQYKQYSSQLRQLNKMKKEFSHLSDADQLPLGL